MREEYEQMELDTRTALDAAIEAVAKDSIQTVLEMIQKHHQQVAREAQTAPPLSATGTKPMASPPNSW